MFQIEEQELASERIGEGAQRRLLFWEAAEGGAGVLARLIDDPGALARVAVAALDICHADAERGEERAEQARECGRACYRCLLSYTNQPDHPLLDRRAVYAMLLPLAHARVEPDQVALPAPSWEAGAALADTAPGGNLVERLLVALAATGRTPAALRPQLVDSALRPDLYFDGSSGPVCVLR